MPVSMQLLTYIDPVRYFMEIGGAEIFSARDGISTLWPQMLALRDLRRYNSIGSVFLSLSQAVGIAFSAPHAIPSVE